MAGIRPGEARGGLTLLEVLSAIGIVGLLTALLLPALQQVRAAARMSTCQSRLRELGAAFHAFEEARQAFPAYAGAYVDLLPYIDQAALYAQIVEARERPDSAPETWSTPVAIFTCPSDPNIVVDHGTMNYLVCRGTRLYERPPSNGIGHTHLRRRPHDISDGLSTTAMVSERRGEYDSEDRPRDAMLPEAKIASDPARYLWYTPAHMTVLGQEERFVIECETRRVSPNPVIERNNGRLCDGPHLYDHLLPPNAVGCLNGPPTGYDLSDRIVPPNSLHAGGVNVLFADGHVAMTADTIDREAWRALGTMNAADRSE